MYGETRIPLKRGMSLITPSGNVKLLSNLPRDIHLDGDMPFQAVVGQVACPDGSNSLPSGQPTGPTDM